MNVYTIIPILKTIKYSGIVTGQNCTIDVNNTKSWIGQAITCNYHSKIKTGIIGRNNYSRNYRHRPGWVKAPLYRGVPATVLDINTIITISKVMKYPGSVTGNLHISIIV